MTDFTGYSSGHGKDCIAYRFAIGAFQFSVITSSKIAWGKNAEVFQTDEANPSVSFAYEILFVNEFEPIWGKIIYADEDMTVMRDGNQEYRVFYQGIRDPFAVAYQVAEQRMRILVDKRLEYFLNRGQNLLSMMALEHTCLDTQTFLLHAAYTIYKNQAIIFIASSGGGKSTQAQLWQQYENAVIVNDDRTFISEIKEQWMACGSPVLGSSSYCFNEVCPIKAVVCLEKATENSLEQLSKIQAFQMIYAQTIVNNWRQDDIRKVVGYLGKMVSEIPVYRYHCNQEKEVVDVLREKLWG